MEVLRRQSRRPELVEQLKDLLARTTETRPQTTERPSWVPHSIRRRITAETRQEIVEAYQGGATAIELGERHGLSKSGVVRLLHEEGVRMRRRGLSPGQIVEAAKLYTEGMTLAAVGKHFEVSTSTVFRVLKEAGVAMRDSHERRRISTP